jgi:hypothetical protein
MKRNITFLFLAAAFAANAQTKVINQATITTKTTIITPEGAEDNMPPAPASANGEEVRVVRFGGDGETKSVTSIKGDMVKTFTESEIGRTTVLRDNNKKITTTLMEMMGNKTGFYATDEEQQQMTKRMDSLMQSRNANGTNTNANIIVSTAFVYTEETKKIAGLVCKKALLVNTRKNDTKDTNTVWYCPDFKLQGVASTGGAMGGFGGFGGRNTSLGSLSELNGFPMQYEMKMNRGRKMIVEVTKINLDKEIADKEFEVPKDFVVKPMKDMQSGDGRVQFRIGGPGGRD